jgi:hypothetical protein
MRVGLLVVAAIAFIGYLAVAVVMPQMAGAEAKEAAQALISGAEQARAQVAAAAEKANSLAGAGKDVKLAEKTDAKHGAMKWIVAEGGAIRGWNEKNALEISLTPALAGGKVAWTCKGYPVNAMPPTCGGR